ncbi:MAG: hypothetical protein ACRDST_07050 [Pseudonocardiaceae bacterium]
MALRANLLAAYTECRSEGDEDDAQQIKESVTELLDPALRATGVRGRLAPFDPPPAGRKRRSTRRRDDARTCRASPSTAARSAGSTRASTGPRCSAPGPWIPTAR